MARQREKDSTSDYRTLNISALKCKNLLRSGASFQWEWWRRGEKVASIGIAIESLHSMRLRYQSRSRGREPTQHDYPVTITWTPCHLGGERPWLLCPCCGRRVAKLYSGSVFACRYCLRLNYPCQQASKRDRALDRTWTLRRKLSCDDGPFDYPAEYIQRPKGMHRKTFARRIEQLSRIEEQAMTNMVTAMQKLGIRITGISL
ncbi:MAG: hypothetical protein Q7J43_04680 [Pseudomonas sp.]|uniref:hypothetical protein n=1 Tax=Pseudomonas sp. TaxID=306 RepID=UPI00271F4AE5|nr:hypothetical protein [Pseudomonas sp.]MDO9616960.1 hypothetical protein [Pseudomonas sp.]MDZ4334252.1 hypothetical protein [Pseudomonas sp.]